MQESSFGDPRTRLCSPVNCVGVHVKSWQYSIHMDHFYYTTYQLLACYGWKSFTLSPEICILDLLKPFSSCFHVNEPQILPHIEHQAEKARCNTDACLIPWHASDFPPTQLSVQTLMMLLQPPGAITGISICMHVTNPQHWQPHHCLDTQKYCTLQKEWVALLLWLL